MNKMSESITLLSLAVVLGLMAGGVPRATAGTPPSEGQKLAHAAQHTDMMLVGTDDLQHRSAYQPTVHKQGDRYILYVGQHSLGTNPVTGEPLPSLNPLTGMSEPNGTSLVDVTNPRNPVYLAHIPVGAPVAPPATPTPGGAQMVRVCDGSTLPIHNDKVYMLRTYTGSAPNSSAHEIWDTTDPSHPKPVRTVVGGDPVIGNLADTHKNWWECDTGIAYLVGRRATDTAAGWRPGNHIMIFDLSNPANPIFRVGRATAGRRHPAAHHDGARHPWPHLDRA